MYEFHFHDFIHAAISKCLPMDGKCCRHMLKEPINSQKKGGGEVFLLFKNFKKIHDDGSVWQQ